MRNLTKERKEINEKIKAELLLKGYTDKTISSYLIHINMYLDYIQERRLRESIHTAKQFLAYLISEENYKPSSIASVRAAIVFYLKNIKNQRVTEEDLPIPKKEKKLPTVLTRSEVRKLIDVAETLRERGIVLMLYSTGVRVGELVKIKVKDIDFEEGVLNVRGGKGKKDRIVILGDKIINFLKEYIKKNNLVGDDYLFFSKHKRNHLTERYIQKVIKELKERAGIQKEVTPHVLRHTFATHLLEQGESIRKIQVLLGHSNLQTTQIYTKVSTEELKKVKNPLDLI